MCFDITSKSATWRLTHSLNSLQTSTSALWPSPVGAHRNASTLWVATAARAMMVFHWTTMATRVQVGREREREREREHLVHVWVGEGACMTMYVYVWVCAYVCVCVPVCVCLCVSVLVCACASMCECVHVPDCVCLCVWVCVCVCVCVCVTDWPTIIVKALGVLSPALFTMYSHPWMETNQITLPCWW